MFLKFFFQLRNLGITLFIFFECCLKRKNKYSNSFLAKFSCESMCDMVFAGDVRVDLYEDFAIKTCGMINLLVFTVHD